MFRAPKLHGFDGPEIVVDPNIHFSPGTPAPPSVLRNVIYIPGADCLYDLSGERIVETCLVRGYKTGENRDESHGPKQISPDASWPIFEEPVLFVQRVRWWHWGHFLTEGVARFWAVQAFPEFKNLKLLHCDFWVDEEIGGKIGRFLNLAEFSPDRLLHFTTPTLLREVIVPAPSFLLRRRAFGVHGRYPEIVAHNVPGYRLRRRNGRPVYLSRSRLAAGNRRIIREQELEKILMDAGVEIVFPETLSLDEQVALFQTRSAFIGAEGSAFHNTLFCAGSPVTTIILTRPTFNATHLLVDAISRVDAHYVNCLAQDESSRNEAVGKVARTLDNILDLDRAVHFLKELGVLGPSRRRLGASEKPPPAQRIKDGVRKLLGRVLRRP